jgi:hypothetical protein
MEMVKKSAALVLGLFVATILWVAALTQPDGKVHLWVLGSKEGLSLLVISGSGQVALVNPGKGSEFYEQIGRHLPFYKRQIDLVIMGEAKNTDPLTTLLTHYRVVEVWTDTQIASQGIKVIQISGFERRLWQGISWQTWQLDTTLVNKLSFGMNSLVVTDKGSDEVWKALPEQTPVEVLVGPPATKTKWEGELLAGELKPSIVITNHPVGQHSSYLVAGEEEIVWDQDSWYSAKR